MLSSLLAAAVAAVAHDRFFAFLNGKSAEGGIFTKLLVAVSLHAQVTDQSLVNFFSNLISKCAVACLSAAIGIAFIQLFWWRMSSQTSTIRHIDDLMDFQEHPFNPFSWRAALNFRVLSIIALSAALIQLGSALPPGALTIDFAYFPSPCNVSTVDLSLTGFADKTDLDPATGQHSAYIATGKASTYVARVLVAGGIFNPVSPCGVCRYNISFVAPAVRCTNVTQALNISINRDLNVFSNPDLITVWHAFPSASDSFIVMSRNILQDTSGNLIHTEDLPVVGLSCTAWNATYDVAVDHDTTTTMTATINIQDQLTCGELCNTNNIAGQQLLGLWDAYMRQLNGSATYSIAHNEFTLDASLAAFSPLGQGSSSGLGWQWAGDLQDLLPMIMQNVSLSLLADIMADSQHTALTPVETTCDRKGLKYLYDPGRLRGTYGGALAITAICIGCGIMACQMTRRSETMNFSRILGAYPDLLELSEPLSLDSTVSAGKEGRLNVVEHHTSSLSKV